jgi:hypothetical protein
MTHDEILAPAVAGRLRLLRRRNEDVSARLAAHVHEFRRGRLTDDARPMAATLLADSWGRRDDLHNTVVLANGVPAKNVN